MTADDTPINLEPDPTRCTIATDSRSEMVPDVVGIFIWNLRLLGEYDDADPVACTYPDERASRTMMSSGLYTDRRDGPRARTVTEIGPKDWVAIGTMLEAWLTRSELGIDHVHACPDNGLPTGVDEQRFMQALGSIVDGFDGFFPVRAAGTGRSAPWDRSGAEEPVHPRTDEILDALEWCARQVGRKVHETYHSYFNHYHLGWDRTAGLAAFVEEVNLLMNRRRLAYEMEGGGRILRLVDGPLGSAIRSARFSTGDPETDEKLAMAVRRFLDRDPDAAQAAIEALWDAFERVKTLEDVDIKIGVRRLLDRASRSPAEREVLEAETRALTELGNKYPIRHHKVGMPSFGEDRQFLDHLFLRLYALLDLLLSQTDRLTRK